MKIRYVILLVFASFTLGGIFSYVSLKSDIEEAKAVYTFVQGYFDLLEEQRAIDSLEVTLDAIGRIEFLQNRDAPRRYIGEGYEDMIKKHLERLESVQQNFDDPRVTQKSEHLIKKAEEMLAEIETEYFN